MTTDFKKILVLASHMDDEISCAGTIAKFLEKGKEIYYIGFSSCKESIDPEFPKDILKKESEEAGKVLGIKPENMIFYDYPVRRFLEFRQDILENLIKLKKEINPDVILLPSTSDIHQDHEVINREGLRAFKEKTILGYEKPWNNINFRSTCLIPLEERHLKKKIEVANCYKSQAHRFSSSVDLIWGLARMRGVQIKEKYAEGFEVLRLVL